MIDTVVLVRQNKKMRERASNLDSIYWGVRHRQGCLVSEPDNQWDKRTSLPALFGI